MPLVARHPELGLLDTTRLDLGCGQVGWSDLHRVRPRQDLRCPACGGRVHAKLSPAPHRLRFFAHDTNDPSCALNGETMAHRLLKLELASAVRDAGWSAELEATGPGFRADVLAVSPDGTHRVVWEAQLASIAVDDIRRRTETITASGAGVCWVASGDTAWFGSVPSIAITITSATLAGGGTATIQRGVARFTGDSWRPPETPLTLGSFVSMVCHQRIRPYQPRAACSRQLRSSRGPTTHPGLVWTAPAYVKQEQNALTRLPEWIAASERSWRNLRALHEVQDHITPLICQQIHQETRLPVISPHSHPPVRRKWGDCEGWGDWAGGVPVRIGDDIRAVVCPVPARLRKWRGRALLPGLTLYVSSEDEATAVASVCLPDQRIIVFDLPW